MGGIFSSPKPPPPPPPPPPPVPLPDTQDPKLKAVKRRTAAEAQNRSGRLSTFLSGSGDTGGSDTVG